MSDKADPMETMRFRYLERLKERQQAIRETWNNLTASNWAPVPLSDLFIHAHKLAGSGATFGFPAITEAARPLEETLKPFRDKGAAPPEENRTELATLIDTLLDTLTEHVKKAKKPETKKTELPAAAEASDQRLICLFSDDPELQRELDTRLKPFGYVLECHPDGCTEAPSPLPTAVLVDLDSDTTRFDALETIQMVKDRTKGILPVVALSRQDTFPMRLKAARAGGETFFTIPLDYEQILRQLDEMSLEETNAPYRILIVDDDEDFVEFATAVLRGEGMQVTAFSSPDDILDVIVDEKPDLILLDLYLGDFLGSEVACVIRQHREHDDLPIIFVTGETDPVLRKETIQSGGTGILAKPVWPPELLGIVTAQVRRFRQLRSLMVRDGLTRLLNHTTIKEQIRMETARAIRNNRPLALAMIDLDDFKKINDTWGHPVGDRVLANLARVLRNRLRSSDAVARYGGEEFVALFPETAPQQAKPIMEEILAQFRELPHQTVDEGFHVTFSAGISGIPGHNTPDGLLRAADETLYKAKRAGKNRVLIEKAP